MQSYLERYSEPEVTLLANFPFSYQHVVCVPAFAENADFLNSLTTNVSAAYALVIVVVNAHTKADNQKIEQTQTLASTLRNSFQLKKVFADNILLVDGPGNMDILLVERCNTDNLIPEAKGVGLARKIACDLACHLIHENKITNPWIHSTDADASLPADYFNGANLLDPQTDSAGIYPFLHTISEDPGILQAQNLYDLSLRYYVDGLSWAGSDSAFHTVGSTLVVNSRHYAQVRGFPQKNAGEDFYLLNKLGKTGNR